MAIASNRKYTNGNSAARAKKDPITRFFVLSIKDSVIVTYPPHILEIETLIKSKVNSKTLQMFLPAGCIFFYNKHHINPKSRSKKIFQL
jgi:hypothetical protein